LNSAIGSDEKNLLSRPRFPGIAASISAFSCYPAKDSDHIVSGGSATFEIEATTAESITNASVSVMFNSDQGYRVLAFSSRCERGMIPLPSGKHVFKCHVDSLPLLEGRYMIDIEIFSGDRVADYVEHATVLDVAYGNFFGRPETLFPYEGRVLHRSDWELD
jgi:hypothetical protein